MWRAAAIACVLLALPFAAAGQQAERVARIAMLRSESRPIDERIRQNLAALRAGLQDGGYVEGRHYRIDYHSPKSEADAATLRARSCAPSVIHASAFKPRRRPRRDDHSIGPRPDGPDVRAGRDARPTC
jgi:hypothetical protein